MKENGFWKSRAGGLTIAFLVIMFAFVVIVAGISRNSQAACTVGLALIVAAMLYSPVRSYILKKK